MLGIGAHCQKPRVHVGVQSFNPAVKALGKTRNFGNAYNFKPRVL